MFEAKMSFVWHGIASCTVTFFFVCVILRVAGSSHQEFQLDCNLASINVTLEFRPGLEYEGAEFVYFDVGVKGGLDHDSESLQLRINDVFVTWLLHSDGETNGSGEYDYASAFAASSIPRIRVPSERIAPPSGDPMTDPHTIQLRLYSRHSESDSDNASEESVAFDSEAAGHRSSNGGVLTLEDSCEMQVYVPLRLSRRARVWINCVERDLSEPQANLPSMLAAELQAASTSDDNGLQASQRVTVVGLGCHVKSHVSLPAFRYQTEERMRNSCDTLQRTVLYWLKAAEQEHTQIEVISIEESMSFIHRDDESHDDHALMTVFGADAFYLERETNHNHSVHTQRENESSIAARPSSAVHLLKDRPKFVVVAVRPDVAPWIHICVLPSVARPRREGTGLFGCSISAVAEGMKRLGYKLLQCDGMWCALAKSDEGRMDSGYAWSWNLESLHDSDRGVCEGGVAPLAPHGLFSYSTIDRHTADDIDPYVSTHTQSDRYRYLQDASVLYDEPLLSPAVGHQLSQLDPVVHEVVSYRSLALGTSESSTSTSSTTPSNDNIQSQRLRLFKAFRGLSSLVGHNAHPSDRHCPGHGKNSVIVDSPGPSPLVPLLNMDLALSELAIVLRSVEERITAGSASNSTLDTFVDHPRLQTISIAEVFHSASGLGSSVVLLLEGFSHSSTSSSGKWEQEGQTVRKRFIHNYNDDGKDNDKDTCDDELSHGVDDLLVRLVRPGYSEYTGKVSLVPRQCQNTQTYRVEFDGVSEGAYIVQVGVATAAIDPSWLQIPLMETSNMLISLWRSVETAVTCLDCITKGAPTNVGVLSHVSPSPCLQPNGRGQCVDHAEQNAGSESFQHRTTEISLQPINTHANTQPRVDSNLSVSVLAPCDRSTFGPGVWSSTGSESSVEWPSFRNGLARDWVWQPNHCQAQTLRSITWLQAKQTLAGLSMVLVVGDSHARDIFWEITALVTSLHDVDAAMASFDPSTLKVTANNAASRAKYIIVQTDALSVVFCGCPAPSCVSSCVESIRTNGVRVPKHKRTFIERDNETLSLSESTHQMGNLNAAHQNGVSTWSADATGAAAVYVGQSPFTTSTRSQDKLVNTVTVAEQEEFNDSHVLKLPHDAAVLVGVGAHTLHSATSRIEKTGKSPPLDMASESTLQTMLNRMESVWKDLTHLRTSQSASRSGSNGSLKLIFHPPPFNVYEEWLVAAAHARTMAWATALASQAIDHDVAVLDTTHASQGCDLGVWHDNHAGKTSLVATKAGRPIMRTAMQAFVMLLMTDT